LDSIVYYCSAKSGSRSWDLWPRNYDYEYEILSGILLKTSVGELNINPSIVKELFLNRPHVLVLGGYFDATMWLAFAVGLILKIPVIFWTEGTKEPQSILGAMTRSLRILFLKKSSAVVVPGRLSRNYVISLGADTRNVFVAPNAIENELFVNASYKYRLHNEELKARLGYKSKVVILYVGRLHKEKGVTFLLEAFGKLKSEIDDIALVIVGYGELYNTLHKLCQEKKINDVVFAGAILDYKQLIEYYSMADIFVLPTLGDVWGFVINEAMACGLPVVATRASQAAQEMIRSRENGYIVKEADAGELFDALKKLVCDAKLREKMGKKSKQIVTYQFDVKRMVEGFMYAINYAIGTNIEGNLIVFA